MLERLHQRLGVEVNPLETDALAEGLPVSLSPMRPGDPRLATAQALESPSHVTRSAMYKSLQEEDVRRGGGEYADFPLFEKVHDNSSQHALRGWATVHGNTPGRGNQRHAEHCAATFKCRKPTDSCTPLASP